MLGLIIAVVITCGVVGLLLVPVMPRTEKFVMHGISSIQTWALSLAVGGGDGGGGGMLSCAW